MLLEMLSSKPLNVQSPKASHDEEAFWQLQRVL